MSPGPKRSIVLTEICPKLAKPKTFNTKETHDGVRFDKEGIEL